MPLDKILPAVLLLSYIALLPACSTETDSAPEIEAALPTEKTARPDICLALPDESGIAASMNGHREVRVEGGSFTMGSNDRYREEAPAHSRQVDAFWIDTHEVTNRQFAVFVEKTGYVTSAEQTPLAANYPDIPVDKLLAGSALFVAPVDLQAGALEGHWTQWWQYVPGVSWKHPGGPDTDLEGLAHHPVVHVSYLDAKAYADWLGRSLPTEAQWEWAAQGANMLSAADHEPGYAANTWQGLFPLQDKALDGFAGTSPVGCYHADARGLHDMIGNVWEWVADVYQPDHRNAAAPAVVRATTDALPVVARVIKGGSHLCAANYCRRDAPQSRQPQEEDFGAGHLGFRTVRNIPPSGVD